MLDCPRKIKLYGDLADYLNVSFLNTYANTATEAIQCLIGNYPQAENYMMDKYYKILVNNKSKTLEELNYPIGNHDIKIVPVITGQGRGLSNILIGGAFIGLAMLTGGGTALFTKAGWQAATWGPKALVGIGASMALGGVAALLTPLPEDTTEEPNSFQFNSPINTNAAGVPVPILYGERMVGSVVISAGINVMEN